jgi:hypothetical protein
MSNFIRELNRSYKYLLSEQLPGQMPAAAPSPDMVAPAPALPTAPMPGMGNTPPQEQPVETPAIRSVSDAFLISMVAKALLIDVDDDDKKRIVKYLKGLDQESANAVEENLVTIINSNDHQILDEDLDKDLEISPKQARKVLKFIKNVMEKYVDTETSEEKE